MDNIQKQFSISSSEEFEKLLQMTGDQIDFLWDIKYNTHISMSEDIFNLSKQILPILIAGYKNFYLAGKIMNRDADKELEEFTLYLEKRQIG
ncbi:MAG: hypothetical protein HC932_01895 [Thermales bacterium]|nr:hypothetical protein [Thermales bacterium]